MGTYRFERPPGRADNLTNQIRFDSSPRYSICKHYGYSLRDPSHFELREVSRDHREIVYEVWASQLKGGTDSAPTFGPLVKRGMLYQRSDEETLRLFG